PNGVRLFFRQSATMGTSGVDSVKEFRLTHSSFAVRSNNHSYATLLTSMGRFSWQPIALTQ
ncbi:hypothetical protein OAN87_01940, partial [bacterium]|nr:hypothetical protein [bacterium]